MGKPKMTDAYRLDDGHHAMDEGATCESCGEDFEVGEWAVEVPYDPEFAPRLVVTIHLHCAVKGDEVDWGQDGG